MKRFTNPSSEQIKSLLAEIKTIAVVGLSPKIQRPSHQVAANLQSFGYRIIPIRPGIKEVIEEPAYPSLQQMPVEVDLVDVFRAPQYVPEIVSQCKILKIKALWLQEGVVNDAAALEAQAAGMLVVMDRCIYKEYISLGFDNI